MEYLTEEYYNTLPSEVQQILDQSEGDMDYDLCKRQIEQLNAIGWDGEYGLDGVIHSVGELKVYNLKDEVEKVYDIIQNVDEVVTNNLCKCEHASEEFKTNQRISNALLNVIRAIDTLRYEL